MRRLLLTFVGLLCYASAIIAQITITGKVIAADDGLPLPGASVIVKGTNIFVSTNLDGEYALSVPVESNTLIF